ncbi:methyl-accepting chemotaxis protein [Gammaproteobacteria bacterium AS21]
MSFLRKINIRNRLILSFTILISLLLIISVVAVTNLKITSQFSEKLITQDVEQGLLAAKVQTLAQSSAINLLLVLNTQERDERVELYKELDKNNLDLDNIINILAMRDGKMVDDKLARLVEIRSIYSKEFLKTVDFVEWDPESAVIQFNEKTHPALSDLLLAIQQYISEQNVATIDSFKEIKAQSSYYINLMSLLALIAMVVGVILAVFVSRSIVLPIKNAVLVAKRISKGDLRFNEQDLGNDEVSQLNKEFIVMAQELSMLMSNICQSAMSVKSSSTTLDSSVDFIANSANVQLTAVGSIADSVSHFSEQSNQAARATSQAKDQATSAQLLAYEGQQLIDKATKEFAVISTSISRSSEAVNTLKVRSESVRKLVTTVQKIADQTNLLALNAAIEAARAGESGRGFSVVADEVRNLALRTGDATQEINEMIDAIERETDISVQTITSGRLELESGIAIISEMVKPLAELNDGAQISVEQLALLESSVVAQAHDSEKIESELQKIKKMSVDNQDAIVSIAKTTQSLGELSQGLQSNISKFKLTADH